MGAEKGESAHAVDFAVFMSPCVCGSILLLLKTIRPIEAMINNPPTNVCGGNVSPSHQAPITTAIKGVTSEIIIAFVDSTRFKSQ
jgi:hypothetical protein